MRHYWDPRLLRKANIDYQKAKRNFKKGKWDLAKKQYIGYINDRNAIDYDAYLELGVCYYWIALKENKKAKNKKLSSSEEKDLNETISKIFRKCLENVRKVEKHKPKKIESLLVDWKDGKNTRNSSEAQIDFYDKKTNLYKKDFSYDHPEIILQALSRVQRNRYEEHYGKPDFKVLKKNKREYILFEAKYNKNNRA